ncbi:hypothetical protein [Sphingomonas cynarae]|uniref:hypothetical protein n=1 Tax=Sphingomonas cynarae TaxID=930197 RepID=UPI0031D61B3A
MVDRLIGKIAAFRIFAIVAPAGPLNAVPFGRGQIGPLDPRPLLPAQDRDVAGTHDLAEAHRIHRPRRLHSELEIGPARYLRPGQRRTVGHQRRRGVEAHRPLPDRRQRAAMAGEQPQRVVRHARSRPQQDDRDRLMRNLVIARRQLPATGGDEAQTPVLDLQPAAIEPH